jgi:ABC-type nickel/cobalt efflux system permease component RcnA
VAKNTQYRHTEYKLGPRFGLGVEPFYLDMLCTEHLLLLSFSCCRLVLCTKRLSLSLSLFRARSLARSRSRPRSRSPRSISILVRDGDDFCQPICRCLRTQTHTHKHTTPHHTQTHHATLAHARTHAQTRARVQTHTARTRKRIRTLYGVDLCAWD